MQVIAFSALSYNMQLLVYIDVFVLWFCVYNIQIWTRDEGNMDFYASEATILTEGKLRSILLL